MKFTDLLKPQIARTSEEMDEIVRSQDLGRRLFLQMLQEHGFREWRPGGTVPQNGLRLLLGLASYSYPDLALVQRLVDTVESRAFLGVIEFFDMLNVLTVEDLRNYIPGIGTPVQTPVAGLWVDGELVQRAAGANSWSVVSMFLSGSG